MTEKFNGLTPAQEERLVLLSEECAEVIAAIAKVQRHGFESTNPITNDPETNRQALERELGHVMAATRLLGGRLPADLSESAMLDSMDRKLKTVGRWLHHNHPLPIGPPEEGSGR